MKNQDIKLEDSILNSIEEAIKIKGSWRLKYAVAELLPELSWTIGRSLSDEHLIPVLEKLLTDSEQEVRSEALVAITEVGKVCDPQLIVEKLMGPISTKLITDPSVHVKASLAECICKIGSLIGKDNCITHIIPIVGKLIKDECTEVRLSLMKEIAMVAKIIGEDATDEHILPSIKELCKDKQWRVRHSTNKYFPIFAEVLDKQVF